MKGLVIWAYSECRSTMATHRALIKAFGVPSKIVVMNGRPGCGVAIRIKTGFRADEFADVEKTYLETDFDKGRQILNETRGWNHLFCDYQGSDGVRRLIAEACQGGGRVGIMTEAPCNMFSGKKRLLKKVFMRTLLPWRVRKVVKAADFFVNFSGSDPTALTCARWSREKVIPFGYFPPPIEGSRCVQRTTNQPFQILSTGLLARYRGADVLVEALRILKERGVAYRATITQDGELLSMLKAKAKQYDLPIEFPGFVAMPDLIRLYETCSVYVGAGRDEPWGMRLNDALNCGAPLVVSSGMGGRKLVDDYGCGLVFEREDAKGLADALRRLAGDATLYEGTARRAVEAAKRITPETKAQDLSGAIGEFENWRPSETAESGGYKTIVGRS